MTLKTIRRYLKIFKTKEDRESEKILVLLIKNIETVFSAFSAPADDQISQELHSKKSLKKLSSNHPKSSKSAVL